MVLPWLRVVRKRQWRSFFRMLRIEVFGNTNLNFPGHATATLTLQIFPLEEEKVSSAWINIITCYHDWGHIESHNEVSHQHGIQKVSETQKNVHGNVIRITKSVKANGKCRHEGVHETDNQQHCKNYLFPYHCKPRIWHYDVVSQLPKETERQSDCLISEWDITELGQSVAQSVLSHTYHRSKPSKKISNVL